MHWNQESSLFKPLHITKQQQLKKWTKNKTDAQKSHTSPNPWLQHEKQSRIITR